MSHLSQKTWHRKAKWLVKKLILKPPENSSQMRDLCSTVVERRFTSQPKQNYSLTNSNQNNNNSTTLTKTIVGTALALWEDKDMVNALNKNQTFLIAKERIQRTASHLLPNNKSQLILATPTQDVILNTLDQVHCPACGRGLQSLNNHRVVCNNPRSEEPSNIVVNDDTRFDVGSVGNIPLSQESEDGSFPSKQGFITHDMAPWFGPLVLAAFAIVGVAVGVYSGEISLPGRVKGLSSRVVAAVDIIIQASNSITKLFAFMN